ncbi:MAG: class I SAM-dependent methyltransferase [Myxococcales bacterium]|nr:class I SAM-dependent methyltransferase [Myxococcales bacterium]
MTQTPADQAELFRKMAAGYDAAIRVYQPSYDDMLHLSTDLAAACAPGRTRCLDYGCGTGGALAQLCALFDEVVAVDPGRAMLDVARARASQEQGDGAARVRFVEGTTSSAEVAALDDASFDAAHCSMVLMFVEGDEAKLATLRALHRLLRPGAALVQTEVLRDADEDATFELWRAIMRRRGATEEQIATGERQIHALMHRRDAGEIRALLAAAGFAHVTQAYQSLHTAIFVARK